MPPILRTIAVAALAFSALSFGLHASSGEMPMSAMSGMSASCLNLCISQGEASAPAFAAALTFAVAFAVFGAVRPEPAGRGPRSTAAADDYGRDRHRYLTRTTVILG